MESLAFSCQLGLDIVIYLLEWGDTTCVVLLRSKNLSPVSAKITPARMLSAPIAPDRPSFSPRISQAVR